GRGRGLVAEVELAEALSPARGRQEQDRHGKRPQDARHLVLPRGRLERARPRPTGVRLDFRERAGPPSIPLNGGIDDYDASTRTAAGSSGDPIPGGCSRVP